MIPRFLPLVVSRGPRDRSQFVVMVALAYVADHATGVCWPKMDWIARHSRMTERGVDNVLSALESDRWLTVERRAVNRRGDEAPGRGAQNRYTLNIARLLRLEPSSLEARSGERRSGEAPSPETGSCAKPVEGLRKSSGKAVGNGFRPERASGERRSKPLEPLIGRPKDKKVFRTTATAGEPAPPVRDGDDENGEINPPKCVPMPVPSESSAQVLLHPSGSASRSRAAHLNREIVHA